MKRNIKIVIACIAMVLIQLLAGCNPNSSANGFCTVFYNGHTYIVYDGTDFDSGMVHDPDCVCEYRKNKE